MATGGNTQWLDPLPGVATNGQDAPLIFLARNTPNTLAREMESLARRIDTGNELPLTEVEIEPDESLARVLDTLARDIPLEEVEQWLKYARSRIKATYDAHKRNWETGQSLPETWEKNKAIWMDRLERIDQVIEAAE